MISFSYSVSGSALYPENYPTNHTEAMSADFLNNLSAGDDNTLLARLGLMTFTTNSSASAVQINIRNQISSTAPNSPPFTPSYQNIWNSVTQYAYAGGGTPTAQALRSAQTFFNTAYNSSQVCRPNFAVMVTDGEDTMGGSPSGGSGNGQGVDYYHSGNFYPNGYSVNVGQVARNNAVIQEAANLVVVQSHRQALHGRRRDQRYHGGQERPAGGAEKGRRANQRARPATPNIPPSARRGTIPRGGRGGPSSPRTPKACRTRCGSPSIR